VRQVGYALLDEFGEEMAEIREELGWAGPREGLHDRLRTDPRYFPESPDEVAERRQAAGDAVWAVAEEGRQFMRDCTLESEAQIATGTLRCSADNPGQALGYQMGKRKFLELRVRAEVALGDRFDIRRFHEALLENGEHPMTVVERHIDRWIEEEGNP
jgi:hypothetical protein